MGKGGKYLAKKAPVKKKKNVFAKILIGLVVILLLIAAAVGIYLYSLMNMITRPDDFVAEVPETIAMEQQYTESMETEPVETSPENTWPQVVADENITNIMLVGQAAREGEVHLISDTMILVSVNREQKTLTLTSLMRDMCLVWPKYVDTLGKEHSGNNRINMAYNMGYSWTKNKQDSMDVLESIVQHNFGIPVERTIEIDFEIFQYFVDRIGGVTVDISQEEYDYLKKNANWLDEEGVHVGENNLNGYHALCYARIRKVGHGDYERTERQREVITSILNKLKGMGILEIHKLFTKMLPKITTDLTNKEITNYAWEFIPMLKDLKIQSQRIPYEDNETSVVRTYEDGTTDYMIAPADLKATAHRLQETIGMNVSDTTN